MAFMKTVASCPGDEVELEIKILIFVWILWGYSIRMVHSVEIVTVYEEEKGCTWYQHWGKILSWWSVDKRNEENPKVK